MTKTQRLKVSEVKLTVQEEDQALFLAMEEGKIEGRATPEEQEDFEKWLNAVIQH